MYIENPSKATQVLDLASESDVGQQYEQFYTPISSDRTGSSLVTNFSSLSPSRTPTKAVKKPWLPLKGGECQFKCCHFCRQSLLDRSYLSLDGIVNDDVPATAITGFGFHLQKHRPVAPVKHVRNLGLRPNLPLVSIYIACFGLIYSRVTAAQGFIPKTTMHVPRKHIRTPLQHPLGPRLHHHRTPTQNFRTYTQQRRWYLKPRKQRSLQPLGPLRLPENDPASQSSTHHKRQLSNRKSKFRDRLSYSTSTPDERRISSYFCTSDAYGTG